MSTYTPRDSPTNYHSNPFVSPQNPSSRPSTASLQQPTHHHSNQMVDDEPSSQSHHRPNHATSYPHQPTSTSPSRSITPPSQTAKPYDIFSPHPHLNTTADLDTSEHIDIHHPSFPFRTAAQSPSPDSIDQHHQHSTHSPHLDHHTTSTQPARPHPRKTSRPHLPSSPTHSTLSLSDLDSLAMTDPLFPPHHPTSHSQPHSTTSLASTDPSQPPPRCSCAIITLFRQHGLVFVKFYTLLSILFTLLIALTLHLTNSTQYCFNLLAMIPWGIGDSIASAGKSKRSFFFLFIVSIINNLLEPIRLMIVLWLLQIHNSTDPTYHPRLKHALKTINEKTTFTLPRPLARFLSHLQFVAIYLFIIIYNIAAPICSCISSTTTRYLFNPLRYAIYSAVSLFFSIPLVVAGKCLQGTDFRGYLQNRQKYYGTKATTFSRFSQYSPMDDTLLNSTLDCEDDCSELDFDVFLDNEFDFEANQAQSPSQTIHNVDHYHQHQRHNHNHHNNNGNLSKSKSHQPQPRGAQLTSHDNQQRIFLQGAISQPQHHPHHQPQAQLALPVHHRVPTLFDHIPANAKRFSQTSAATTGMENHPGSQAYPMQVVTRSNFATMPMESADTLSVSTAYTNSLVDIDNLHLDNGKENDSFQTPTNSANGASMRSTTSNAIPSHSTQTSMLLPNTSEVKLVQNHCLPDHCDEISSHPSTGTMIAEFDQLVSLVEHRTDDPL